MRLSDLIRGSTADVKVVFPKDSLELLMIQEMRSEYGGDRFVSVDMRGDKKEKASAGAALVRSGAFYVVGDGGQNLEFVRELCEFPNGRHDDCVDCFSLAIHHIGFATGFDWFIERSKSVDDQGFVDGFFV